MVKLRGPDPHLMDHGGAGPQWVDLGQGVGDDLIGARPNGCSRARRVAGDGATERESSTGSPSQASPGRGRRRGNRAMAVKKLW
jgi:hypothetical protein